MEPAVNREGHGAAPRGRAPPTPARSGPCAGGAARVPDARGLGAPARSSRCVMCGGRVGRRGGSGMATGGPGAGRPSARWWPTHRPFWAPSSVTNASAPRVYQRVVCHEIRSKLSPPMDCSGASTRFLASRKVAPPPAPPQRRSSMRADPPAGRISRNASLGSHDAWRRRATRRTRWLVVPGRRFPSTAGMDSGEINTRVSGALCGRRSEGTAFASSAAGRWRHTSWH